MAYLYVLIFLSVLIGGIFFIIKSFANNKKEEGFSILLFSTGLEAVISSFGTVTDKIFSTLAIIVANMNENQAMQFIQKSSEPNIVQLIVGSVMIVVGIALFLYAKHRLYILNINGYYDKRIENHNRELGLSAFEFKEREIDFIRIYNKGINRESAKEIYEMFQEKLEKFKNESKDFNRGYTGIAPIPFIMLAGTFLKREGFNDYYEYNKINTQKYYKLGKGKTVFGKKYPPLKLTTNITNVNPLVNEVVIAVSITSEITNGDLAQFNGQEVVKLTVDNPSDNFIKFREQLNDYKNVINTTIEKLNNSVNRLNKIHLVYSGQSCLAFEIGKIVDDNRMPQIINYQFNAQSQKRYPWGIVLNGGDRGRFVEVV